MSKDEGMTFKDALEHMALTGNKLYSSSGVVWEIDGHKLIANDELLAFPLHPTRFKELRLFTSNPKAKPVFIPFWDAVKEMVSNGKVIGRFCDGTLIDSYKNTFNGVVYWSTMGKHHWKAIPHFLSEWSSTSVQWAIVEDPSHSN